MKKYKFISEVEIEAENIDMAYHKLKRQRPNFVYDKIMDTNGIEFKSIKELRRLEKARI